MPELPEVEALSAFLDEKLAGRTVAAALPVAFQALKTYDPPLSALEGRTFDGVGRLGKFVDLRLGDLHLVIHLSRAGWIRWKDELPPGPPRPGKGPLALRVRLAEPGSAGFDVTEAGTQKRLAISVVRDPADVPGVARLGVDPLSAAFTADALAGLLKDERRLIKGVLRDQSVIAGIGNAYPFGHLRQKNAPGLRQRSQPPLAASRSPREPGPRNPPAPRSEPAVQPAEPGTAVRLPGPLR